VPVDAVAEPHPKVEIAPEPVRHAARDLDTGTIERVLGALEPVDHTTSFEHEPTARLPLLRAEPPAGGKRRAVKQADGGSPFLKGFLTAPVLVGVAALALSVGGVVTVDGAAPAASSHDATVVSAHGASALGGTSGVGKVSARSKLVTRDADRTTAVATGGDTGQQLQAAADATAEQRDAKLLEYDQQAEKRAKVLAKDVWVYPLEPVILTARFGEYGLWSSMHTGLDFNGETGDLIHAIASGTVISAQYDGSYGNKTVVLLPDGTELWYCHQSAFLVSVGDTVTRGQVIGRVGATGHVTGSHLHVEVRPGGGDPVDPYPAMQQHGLFLGSEAQPG
jgi:murein DD-endopeptidase MepM/ murein hydrolase activator NlpD